MNPGELNRRVQLHYFANASQQPRRELGAPQSSPYVNGPTVWARVRQSGSREIFHAQRNNSEISLEVIVRYREEIDSKSRLSYGGKDYEVIGEPEDIEDRREYLRLLCKVVT